MDATIYRLHSRIEYLEETLGKLMAKLDIDSWELDDYEWDEESQSYKQTDSGDR